MIFDLDQCAREIQEARHRAEALLHGCTGRTTHRPARSGEVVYR